MNNIKLPEKNPDRVRRSKIVYITTILVFTALTISLLLAFRSLIMPTIIGMLSAYIVFPLLNRLRRFGMPKWAALLVLFSGFSVFVFIIGKQVASLVPNEKEKLELRVQIQYKVNEEFLAIMGQKEFYSEGNFIYSFFGDELTPLIETFNEFIALDAKEKELFKQYINGDANQPEINHQVAGYFEEVSKLPFPKEADASQNSLEKEKENETYIPISDSKISKFVGALSNWIVLPFVFLFLLLDDGEIKRFFIGLMPNKYFEMSLTIFDSVDTAIGNYLRGTLLECLLVGVSFIIGLTIIGFNFQAAALIGILAGVANAIPFLGPVLGLGIGLLYAMIVEGINPIIPFISIDPIFAVVIVVAIVQGLDNSIFQPLVLGKAVNLHPLVVVLGVTGGSILFGFAGMLFAIPAIVVAKVIVSTVYKQLKLYYLIY